MYSSSSRTNFLDILLDPSAIAILGSIVLHATLGASLPFLIQPEKADKKVGPTTVKVVELTPSELQRIPQAPPTPAPQVSPSVTQPIPTPRPSVAPPSTPQFSTAPQTIPFSPIRIPITTPTPKPLSGKKKKGKQQPAITKQQPDLPTFDPNNIFKSTPKLTKVPVPTGITPKPSVQVSPTPTPTTTSTARSITKKTQTSAAPTSSPQAATTGGDGGETQSTQTTTPTRPDRQPAGTSQPSGSSNSAPTTPQITQPSGDVGSGDASGGFYGKYVLAANAQLQRYVDEYKVPPSPPKTITRSYPQTVPCTRAKQAPFIVLMAVFDKVPDSPNQAILGTGTAAALKISTFKDQDTQDQRDLADIATRLALEEASKAEQNRPEQDKGKRVIYQYRVQFDPATCKK